MTGKGSCLMRPLLCFGHRGARGHAPENTLAGFRTALDLGVDGVELDVHLVDDRLIVIHDDTLDRTTNGKGSIHDAGFDSLRDLDAGDGEKIPVLEEVFDLLAGRLVMNIELKGRHTAEPVVAMIRDQRTAGRSDDRILISSFDHDELVVARRHDDRVRIGVLYKKKPADALATAMKLDAYAVIPSIKIINETIVRNAQAEGLKVYVFTVNDPADIARVIALGVDGLISDYPERAIAERLKIEN